jgi:GTP cyclohydrolase II
MPKAAVGTPEPAVALLSGRACTGAANEMSFPLSQSDPPAAEPATAAVLSLRAVHRALGDLRRGTPVLLGGVAPLALLAAETAGDGGLDEFRSLIDAPPLLLLAPARAEALRGGAPVPAGPVVALRLPPAALAPAALGALADPLAAQLPGTTPQPVPQAPALAPEALALVKLAQLLPAVLVAPPGAAAAERAAALGLLTVTAADVRAYPRALASRLVPVAEAMVPLADAPDAKVVVFRAPDLGVEHVAVLIGHPEQVEVPLVRLHSECFTGDVLASLRCDCGAQLHGALRRMQAEGAGVLLYLAQEGRGIGLANKLRAYSLQDRGLDTVEANLALGWGADERSFLVAATMLRALGVRRLRLLTNNPAKVSGLSACDIEVVAREGLVVPPNGVNDRYLATKAKRFGHVLG